MMGLFDKIKKAFGSKKEDVESQNSDENIVNEEVIDKQTPNDKIRNFKYLDDLVHSGVKEIVLDSDIVLSDGEESQYLKGIRLDVDNLTIDGNGHTIDAQGKTQIFCCTGKNITIKNITLKNGFTEETGGGIHNEGSRLTIVDSILTGNTAKRHGGAICNWNGELYITESTLTGNTAQGEWVDGGGAIYNWGILTISESTLTKNIANFGGAIYNIYRSSLTITESTLTKNIANFGGAIYNENGSSLTITESTLTQNIAKEDSGAILNGGNLTITKSTIKENEYASGAIDNTVSELTIANSTIKETEYASGAIHNQEGNLKIHDCEFLGNASLNNIILNNDYLQIYNTSFRDNKSEHIVFNEGDESNLGIFYGEFKENNIEKSILFNDGKFCIIEKTTFHNNISNNTLNIINKSELTLTNPKIKDKGKSILNHKYLLIRNSSPELENIIYGEGAVENIENRIPQGENFDFGYLDKKIHESNTKEIILDHDMTLETYERDFYEGGIELDIDNLIIDGNGKTINGSDKSRIFIITGKNITLKNIIFKNGHSHKNYDNPLNNNGGAIKINHNNNIKIQNCEFINNTSEEDSGVIHNRKGELTIIRSTLNKNTSQQNGGAINNRGGKLTIIRSTLNENIAKKDGGAIYNDVNSSLSITDSKLNKNTAQKTGGAISNYMGEITITHSTLNENTAQEGDFSGEHDILAYMLNELHPYKKNISREKPGCGGAIYNIEGNLTITESTLTQNIAQKGDGGAIYNFYEKSFNIKNCKLQNNTPHHY